jgi:hypothetical protein
MNDEVNNEDGVGCLDLELSTADPGYNEQKAFQSLDLLSRGFHLYGDGEHSNIFTCLIDNKLEHSP